MIQDVEVVKLSKPYSLCEHPLLQNFMISH
jgi:hypothetical protein